MSGLNRMARVKGSTRWLMCGAVSYIEAAERYANDAWKRTGPFAFFPLPPDELDIEVRCESDDPTRDPYCFKMKRRVVWDCLNPRQGADDPKPKKPDVQVTQRIVDKIEKNQQEDLAFVDRIINESGNQWLGQNGPGAAKVQVALPPKAQLRTKTDYSQELMFDIFVVSLNAEDWKAIQEIRSRRKTQVAG